jgi:uncharacterized protein with PIN domain
MASDDERLDAEADVERILAEMRDALERVRRLGELLSVCGSCKAIRDIDGQWRSMEEFLSERLRVRFSHGLCPCCGERLLARLEAS